MKTVNTSPASQGENICLWWKKVIEMSTGIHQKWRNDEIVAEIQPIEKELHVKPLHKAYVSVHFLCVPGQLDSIL